MSLEKKKLLGKCITKPQVLLQRFKFLFMHKRARRGTFSCIGRGTSVFSFSLSIPCCLRSPDKTHKFLGRSNLSMLSWDSDCLMELLITWFYLYIYNSLVLLWDASVWSGDGGAIPFFVCFYQATVSDIVLLADTWFVLKHGLFS